MTTQAAIETLKAAGFANAHFNCGKVWFRNSAGKLFAVNTDFRAQVSSEEVSLMIKHASA